MARNLLFELGCEELPPKALKSLAEALEEGVVNGLQQHGLSHGQTKWYATPRRLAIHITDLDEQQADKTITRRGPAIKAAFDGEGQPTKATIGFARSCHVELDQLELIKTDKGEWLGITLQEKGQPTTALLQSIIENALKQLPIPKRMRWGSGDASFIRPVHWVVLLFSDKVVDTTILGLQAGCETRGHRFHSDRVIIIDRADKTHYEEKLYEEGSVFVDFEKRSDWLLLNISKEAEMLEGHLYSTELVAEVTSITEWPVAISGGFDPRFLDLPKEALVAEMQQHQRYFPVTNENGDLLPHFITVSNIDSKEPERVQKGNERVINARLSDAEFFWQQDKKSKLADRLDALDKVLFEASLGSLKEKSKRVEILATAIAEQLDINPGNTQRTAQLCKCDLLTEMVGEFPELQGLMGRYYAELDDEDAEVCHAIEEHYWPRHAGDDLPTTQAGQCVALADRIDTLVGIFGIGQKPTGEKDPYALRRASLGVLRIMIEQKLSLNLAQLLNVAAENYGDKLTEQNTHEVLKYIMERLVNYYADQGIGKDIVVAVLASDNTSPLDIDDRISAVYRFRNEADADNLIAGYKRINNILRKIKGDIPTGISPALFEETSENKLFDRTQMLSASQTGTHMMRMEELATLQQPIDDFFEKVMVMADDDAVRNNRIALLKQTHDLFMQIADLSLLQQVEK